MKNSRYVNACSRQLAKGTSHRDKREGGGRSGEEERETHPAAHLQDAVLISL